MWLYLALTFSIQDLKAFLPSPFPQRFSRRGPSLLPRVRPCLEGHLWTEDEVRKTLDRGLTHVFCPAEPTKNCPRDQPQDISALPVQLERLDTLPGQLHYLEGQPLRHATICYSGSFWPKVWFIFHSCPFNPPSLVRQVAFHEQMADHASAHLQALKRKSWWAHSKDFKEGSSNRS